MRYAQNIDLSKYCIKSDPFILKQHCTIHNHWKPNMQKFWLDVFGAVVDNFIPFIIFAGIFTGLVYWSLLVLTR